MNTFHQMTLGVGVKFCEDCAKDLEGRNVRTKLCHDCSYERTKAAVKIHTTARTKARRKARNKRAKFLTAV